MPQRAWKTASASPPPIPISTWPRRFSRASTASTASSIPARRPTRPTRPRRRCCRRSLRDAVAALKDDPFFREKFGAEFVDYYMHIKNAEIDRFQSEVYRLGAPRIFRGVFDGDTSHARVRRLRPVCSDDITALADEAIFPIPRKPPERLGA